MKQVLLMIAMAAGSVANAFPDIHDSANYLVSSIVNGKTTTINVEVELTGYDAANDSFLMRTTNNASGAAKSSEEWVKKTMLPSSQFIKDLLEQCETQGGRTELLSVPAGEFTTCAYTSKNEYEVQTVWIADVPFGLAKQTTKAKDGSSITTYELGAFHSL